MSQPCTNRNGDGCPICADSGRQPNTPNEGACKGREGRGDADASYEILPAQSRPEIPLSRFRVITQEMDDGTHITYTDDSNASALFELVVSPMGGGSVMSTVKDACPHCGMNDCYLDCKESRALLKDDPSLADDLKEDAESRMQYNLCVDGIESLLLSMMCAGVDMTQEGICEAAFKAAAFSAMAAVNNG